MYYLVSESQLKLRKPVTATPVVRGGAFGVAAHKDLRPGVALISEVASWTVPFRNTVRGLLSALSFMMIFAVSFVPPDADGVKFTVKVQLAPAPKAFGLMGQSFV